MVALIVIILSTQMLYAYTPEGQLWMAAEVAVGSPNTPTPVGETVVEHVIYNPWWRPRGKPSMAPRQPGNPMGRVKLALRNYGAVRIHGGGLKVAMALNVPRTVSNGCVRMRDQDVQALAAGIVGNRAYEEREAFWLPVERAVKVVIRQ